MSALWKESESRLGELDALRGIAALGVVLWHYSGHFGAKPLNWLFAPFYSRGLYLVDFFFVLSGFILCRAYLNEQRIGRLKENIIRRIARLYPLHFVTLVLAAIGQLVLLRHFDQPFFIYQYNDAYHMTLNLLLAQFIGLQGGMSFNGPSWSISTEFYVSLLFFVVVARFRRPALVFSGLLLAALGLFAIGSPGKLIMPGNLLFVDAHLVRTLLGFSVGVLLYQLTLTIRRSRSWLFDISFLAGLVLLIMAGAARDNSWLSDFVVVLLGFPFLIYAVLNAKLVPKLLQSRPLSFLGHISYSLYLVHFPAQLLFHTAKVSGFINFSYESPLTLAVFILFSIALSVITYYFVELPTRRLMTSRWAKAGGGIAPVNPMARL